MPCHLATGAELAALDIAAGADGIYYDGGRALIYVSCAAGWIEVIRQVDADHYIPAGRVVTARLEGRDLGSAMREIECKLSADKWLPRCRIRRAPFALSNAPERTGLMRTIITDLSRASVCSLRMCHGNDMLKN